MKHAIILFSILISCQHSFSQSYNKGLLLRGKAFGMFIIEDLFFNNYNLGLEYRFAECHSFGIDYVHFRWRREYDIYVDGYDSGSGPDAFSRRRYLLVDYRYYPFRRMMPNKGFELYINPFMKLGRRKIWTNDPYTYYSDNDLSSIKDQRSDFADYGFAIGTRVDFGSNNRFGMDVNIGAVYRDVSIRYEEQYDYDSETYIERFSGKRYYWKPHMRLNLYWRFLRFNN